MRAIVPYSFRSHLIKSETMLAILFSSGRANTLACSILLVESYFRPLSLRILEYVYWLISGAAKITIGMAQVEPMHFRKVNCNSVFGRIVGLRQIFSFLSNYDAVRSFLFKNGIRNEDSLNLVAFVYNGANASTSYRILLKHAYNFVKRRQSH